MNTSAPTDDGFPVRCEICGHSSIVDVSRPPGDSVCPNCGCFLWVYAIAEITSQHNFVPDVRLPELTAGDKDSALREMIDCLAAEFGWSELRKAHLYEQISAREQIGSTGIGNGVAVPHARTAWADRCTSAMAASIDGINFDALDGLPVHTLVMLVSPREKPGDHLRYLQRISRSIGLLGRTST